MKKFLLMFTLVGLVIFGCNYSCARDGITYDDNLMTWTDLNGNSFEYGTITIEHDGKTITMMDRNLGATTNNINSNGSFGYYYQRGNNYGFSSNFELLRTGENPVNASSYGPGNYYSRAVYTVSPREIYDGDRSTVRNDNLWGGSGDNFDNNYLGYPVQNPTDRQGPCPDGYHVPSMGERLKVVEWWALNNKSAGYGNVLDYTNNFGRPGLSGGLSRFRSDFFIPESKSFAVHRYEYDDGYSISENLNFLRSSSSIPYSSGYCDLDGCISYNVDYRNSRALFLYTPRLSSVGEGRDLAAPIRCFKNPDNSPVDEDISFSIDIDSTTSIGKTEFEVKVMKDGATFRDYTGTIYLYLTDKYGNTTDEDIYGFSDGKYYKFNKSDRGRKTFSVKVEEEGTYVLRINDSSNDDFKGSEIFTVKGNNSNNDNFEFDYSKFNPYYSDEMNKAYQYAYHYGITTISSIANANMDGGLTRIAMAKMLSYFAENVLGMDDFDTRRNCDYNDVSAYLDRQYNYGVTKACQLGIMGINMQNNNFNPYGTVTRAQFATALSRLLYGTNDGTYNYYSTHITKLYNEGIISNTNPDLQERRGYVMLMLMRSQDGSNSNNNNSSTTYHSPNMINMSNFLTSLTNFEPELTCNRTEKVYRENGRDFRYKSSNKWTADARFVNNVLQTVRNSGQYLVEDYIRQANDVLDSVGLTNENRCRYSFLIYALENQRGELTSYKTQNGITTIGVDFYSYKETLGEYDIDPAGGTYLIYKNTSKKSRNYRLSENPQLEILKVDSNGHTNAVYYFDGPETRSYISNWNTRINTYCNNEIVYNGKSPYPDGNGYNYNWNTNNALCIKNRLSNPGENPLTFTFDDLGNISKIGGFYYWLAFHS